MAITITKDIPGTYKPGKSATLNFTIRGAKDEAEATNALIDDSICPSFYMSDNEYIINLPRKEFNIDAEHIDETNPDANIFRAKVRYYATVAPNVVSFDTTGGEQHITQSGFTTVYSNGVSPNMQGAIGYDGERVQGVSIAIPSYTFTEEYTFKQSFVDDNYRRKLALMTATVNDGTFRKFAAGEVMFKGATGTTLLVDSIPAWRVQYHFAVSPNLSQFAVGSITVAQKLGWEYLWTLYEQIVDANNLIKVPRAVYVERLFTQTDFSDLGLPYNPA
jgi:hypothetical protein